MLQTEERGGLLHKAGNWGCGHGHGGAVGRHGNRKCVYGVDLQENDQHG